MDRHILRKGGQADYLKAVEDEATRGQWGQALKLGNQVCPPWSLITVGEGGILVRKGTGWVKGEHDEVLGEKGKRTDA